MVSRPPVRDRELRALRNGVELEEAKLRRMPRPKALATRVAFVTGGGWLCEHLWEHYAYTHDRNYLRSIYPVMREAALFFLDSMIEEPTHHWLVTAPLACRTMPRCCGHRRAMTW